MLDSTKLIVLHKAIRDCSSEILKIYKKKIIKQKIKWKQIKTSLLSTVTINPERHEKIKVEFVGKENSKSVINILKSLVFINHKNIGLIV